LWLTLVAMVILWCGEPAEAKSRVPAEAEHSSAATGENQTAAIAESRPPAPAEPESRDLGDPGRDRSLVLDSIETEGNHRTHENTILYYLPLRPGDRVDQQAILDAVSQLRQSDLFAQVDSYTKPGNERGHIILVLEVREKGFEFRLGTGNIDLYGWYLIPAELALDNRFGRGERLDLQWKFGYRFWGFFLNFAEPRFGDGQSFWGTQGSLFTSDRIYFYNQVEYSQKVNSVGLNGYLGRRLSKTWSAALGLGLQGVDADSNATVYTSNPSQDARRGDELPYEELPPGVAAGVGQQTRLILRANLLLDSRSGALAAGSPADGFWGRFSVAGFLQGDNSFGSATFDLRTYRRFLGGALAVRFRASAVGRRAAYYDKLYLGGLYTVRGFPSQSLSAPAGDIWLWNSSLEYRAPLIGNKVLPRLAGLLFLDVGDSGTETDPALRDLSVGAGWGLRLRFWWIGWLGLDVGIPLSYSPVDESFRLNASIGWTF